MALSTGTKNINTAVFISGTGSNLKSLIKFSNLKKSPISIKMIISNNPKSKGLAFGKIYKIRKKVFNFNKQTKTEKEILELLKKRKINLICLAGFMRILSKNFIQNFKGQILNIHPSLLPKYKGLNTHERAIKNKDRYSGCTVHFVTAKLDSGKIICCYSKKNLDQLALLSPETGELEDLDLTYTSIGNLSLYSNRLLTVASSPTLFPEIIEIELSTKTIQTIKTSTDLELDQAYLSVPETIEFPTGVNAVAHGFYYPPINQGFQGLDGETPPLIVMLHGGPTSATQAVLSFKTQYWTTRGFGVLDLNYRGSTGYGRAYQDELIRQWGIIDVEDAVAGAEYLVRQQKADPLRLAIQGGSAGGYTTLAALTFADTFKAGASLYGISDLEILAQETHKFESRYLDQLIGDYPEEKEVYQARSPINHLDQLSSPCIFFHGLEDQVVPPNQAEMMVEALRTKGIPVAYVPFEKEQHGFRIAKNIKRCLELELYFYARIFGFQPADPIEPIVIDNLEE